MLFVPNSEMVKAFHYFLSLIYEESEDPKIKITQGFVNEGLIDGCINYATTDKLFGQVIFGDVISMAACLLKSLIQFHPFIDGNKRTALLTTFFFLQWNGYEFFIEEDSVNFTVGIADPNVNVKLIEVIKWIRNHVKRTMRTRLRSVLLNIAIRLPSDYFIERVAFWNVPRFVEEVMERYRPT